MVNFRGKFDKFQEFHKFVNVFIIFSGFIGGKETLCVKNLKKQEFLKIFTRKSLYFINIEKNFFEISLKNKGFSNKIRKKPIFVIFFK